MQELKQGTSLQGGKYIIKRVLGQGGFGITYLAEQVSLRRDVAIKEFFMQDGCLRDQVTGRVTVPPTGAAARVEQFHKKFLKEARTLASLDHPYIINVIDVFEENGTVYYSMPYMSNGSLKSLVQQRGRLPEPQALRYIGQVVSALKYMHDRHICHYDVKPDNILLDSRDNAVLIDFGISKNYDSEGNETSTTPIGISEGYAPIEQYQGISGFSPASDIYALGATLYYLMMGQTPYSAIDRIQGKELAFPNAISEQTLLLIKQLMQLQKNERPQKLYIDMSHDESLQDNTPLKPSHHYNIYAEHIAITPKIEVNNKQSENGQSAINTSITKTQKNHVRLIVGITAIIGLVVACVFFLRYRDQAARDLIIQKAIDDMVYVTGGTFTMGATAEQGSDASDNEKPAHQVTLSDYHISKYEVTQELWHAVMGSNPSKFVGDSRRPVESVSWLDCQLFLKRLNRLTKRQFRLPTEAEWEYAARGGSKSRGYKYAGGNTLDNVAFYDENSGDSTHPVGWKLPNELGLYDMSGNVGEWCQDEYARYTNSSQKNQKYFSETSYRVIRGGSWSNTPGFKDVGAMCCRVSHRGNDASRHKDKALGLRLAE